MLSGAFVTSAGIVGDSTVTSDDDVENVEEGVVVLDMELVEDVSVLLFPALVCDPAAEPAEVTV